jgi:hypothetical protein
MTIAARLAAYYFAFFAHAGAYVSYFALYLAGRGMTAGEIAFAVAMPQAARIAAPALWGWLADAWGAHYGGARQDDHRVFGVRDAGRFSRAAVRG